MTEYEMMKTALFRAEGAYSVEVSEWEDGSSLIVSSGGSSTYFEFDENGNLCYCNPRH